MRPTSFNSLPLDGLSPAGAHTVDAAALGVFDNYAGGLLVRFTFIDGDSQLLSFQNELVFEIVERFGQSLEHFRKHGFPANASIAPVGHVLPEDFDLATSENDVGTWSMHAASDAILWRMTTRDGASCKVLLRPSLVASIHQALVQAINLVMLIDLRPFKDMRWTKMSEVFESHPGHVLRERIRAFEFSVEILRRNGKALITHLQTATGVLSDELVRWDRRFQIDTFLSDSIYLLFNFVGSAKALVDHTRAFYRRCFEPREKIAEYPTEIAKRFGDNGLIAFVHDMRDLMAHVGLVGLVHEKRFQKGDVTGHVVMNRDDALKWEGWRAPARTWLKAGPREIDMLEVIRSYMATIEDFQSWFASEREQSDWRDFRYAELLRRAILARRGIEDIPSLQHLLTLPHTAIARMRDAVGAFLTAEQQFHLRADEGDGGKWLQRALVFIRERYYVPEKLGEDLQADFCQAIPE